MAADECKKQKAELEAQLIEAEKAIKAHAVLLSDATTAADRQTRRADSYARSCKDLTNIGAELKQRAEKAEADAARLKGENVRLREALANAKGAAFVRFRQEEWDKELDMLARCPMLEADNAKLRELCERAWRFMDTLEGWQGNVLLTDLKAALSPRQPESEGK